MPENKEIQKIIKKIPSAPGIYKMIDEEGRVLYVGKAKDLAKRVRQYFQKNYEHSTRTRKLVEQIRDIETITVDTELEAMILETNIIKQLQPKYNILMKDDKNYVYIKITEEDFPRIQIVRKIEKDGARYIGPKTAAHKVKETLKILKKLFPFRHCSLDIAHIAPAKVKVTHKTIKYPCLDYHIKRCIGPCIAKCSPEEYREIIRNVENFLHGRGDEIMQNIKKQMQELAQNRQFEKAAKLRDKMLKVQSILEKQKVSDPNSEDTDIINYCITQGHAYFNLFQSRDGKLIGQENFILSAKDLEESESEEALEAFLRQYYEIATDIPKEILIPHPLQHHTEIAGLINKQSGKKILITIPKQGTKDKLLKMSLKNAQIFADRNKPSWQNENELTIKATEELQKLLHITTPLNRIECYDISHLAGTDTVGSMIVFQKGAPANHLYRKFKLRTVVNKPDDYKSMEEVLTRRLGKIAEEMHQQDYKFRKALKKDKTFIEKHNDIDVDKKDRQFYILEKVTTKVGFIAIVEHSKTVSEITNLWLTKNERGKNLGHKLIKETIKKTKSPRVYIICREELREYYQLLGFEDINKIPTELEKHYKECLDKCKKIYCLVYDKKKSKPDESFTQIPDLIIIDGGKGQLAVAAKVLNDLRLKIPHISLAKRLEEIFTSQSQNPILLPQNNEALKLLQRARDEAHRFAISYNKVLRSKKLRKKS